MQLQCHAQTFRQAPLRDLTIVPHLEPRLMDALEAYQSLDWPDGRDRSEQTVVEEGSKSGGL